MRRGYTGTHHQEREKDKGNREANYQGAKESERSFA
jgi:hypothetical protein